MIYQSIALALCTQLALACIPMQPGEDMPCPSIPQAETVNGYAVEGLTKTMENGAVVLSCKSPAEMLEVDEKGNITPVPIMKIKCLPNSAMFVDEKNMDVKGKTYNCGTKADCDKCKVKVDELYNNNLEDYDLVRGNPTCEFKCKPTSNMIYKDMPYTKAVCQIISMDVTVDSGEMVSGSKSLTCRECKCPTDQVFFNKGDNGLCPLGKLCGAPVPAPGTTCQAVCPVSSTPTFKDKDGVIRTSPTIKCLGSDWIEVGSDANFGITCQYDNDKGYTKDPPKDAAAPCNGLLEQQCPRTNGCDMNQLVYTEDGNGGYEAMCKTGVLITDQAPNVEMGGSIVENCFVFGGGAWASGITTANCLTDDMQAPMCAKDLAPANMFTQKCAFGRCGIVCSDAAKKMKYGTQTADYFSCTDGTMYAPDGNPIDDATKKGMVSCA